MTHDEFDVTPGDGVARKPYEPPAVIEVFIDPAKDMLVACAPGKMPNVGGAACNAVQFS